MANQDDVMSHEREKEAIDDISGSHLGYSHWTVSLDT
jgi:hypothetical protein